MKISKETKRNLRRLTEAEYVALIKENPPNGVKRNPNLRRLTDEEYQKLIEGGTKDGKK
jgi:hypothetical protein